jgi:hypothetical protein
MASAWGTSWGSAWGDSWGSIDSSGVGAPSERARVNLLGPADKIDDTLQPRLFDMIEQLLNGQSRNASTVTLDTGETSTTVDDPLVESQQIVLLQPMSADAAAAMATTYVSSVTDGSFTITHASASGDEVFGYVFVG